MELEDQLKQLEKEILHPLVDEMMKKEAPPPNGLVSPQAWKEKKKQELLEFYSGKKDFDRVNRALEVLNSDFSSHLTPIELDTLSVEWQQGIENINVLFNKPVEEPLTVPNVTLSEMMHLSDTFIETFYSVGVKCFQKQDYTKAADIFFLLSLIDFKRHAIWLSLGLAEMKIKEYEPALHAFAMASITNSQTPYPYIYSAECCIALDRFAEASTYFDLAKETISQSTLEEKGDLLGQIKNLESKAKF